MKKIINILLCAILLCGCTKEKENSNNINHYSEEGSYYINELINFKNCEKNINNDVDNDEFNSFLNNLFLDTINQDYLTMSFTIKDYHDYEIEKPEVTLGYIAYNDTSAAEEYKLLLEELEAFDPSSLSYTQQYDYDSLRYSLLETIALDYYDLESLYTSSNNIVDTIITNLNEFTFYNSEQVDDYLILVADIDRYLDDSLTYTKAQIDDHIYISDGNLDYCIEYNDNFTSKVEDNELIVSFNDKIDDLDFISEQEKQDYKAKNYDLVVNEVIPSVNEVSDTLKNYYGLFDYDNGQLVNIDSDYTKLVYMSNCSTNYSIDDIYNTLIKQWNSGVNEYIDVSNDEDTLNEYLDIVENYGSYSAYSDSDFIEYNIANYEKYFPKLNTINYEVDRLDESIASDLVLAYYMLSKIDDISDNHIKINPNATDDKVEVYNTLAHEGIPGHMYQHNYYWSTSPSLFRSVQSFIGYTEGWACYASDIALSYFDCLFEGTNRLINFDTNYTYILYSIIDIGINYYGWSKNDTYNKLDDLGLSLDRSTSDNIYETLVDLPGVYCRYGVGYAYFLSLKEEAENKLNDKFDLVTYNEYLLKNGPLPFNILSDCVNEYISKYANQ